MKSLLFLFGVLFANAESKTTESAKTAQGIFSQLGICAKSYTRTQTSTSEMLRCSESKFVTGLQLYERQELLSIFAAPFRVSPIEVCDKLDSERAGKMRLGHLKYFCFSLIDDQNIRRKGFAFFESTDGNLKIADIKIL